MSEPDDLDAFIADESRRDPAFAAAYEWARRRSVVRLALEPLSRYGIPARDLDACAERALSRLAELPRV